MHNFLDYYPVLFPVLCSIAPKNDYLLTYGTVDLRDFEIQINSERCSVSEKGWDHFSNIYHNTVEFNSEFKILQGCMGGTVKKLTQNLKNLVKHEALREYLTKCLM